LTGMDPMTPWLSPPAEFSLPPGSLQIWRSRLGAGSDSLARYSELLSPNELARADRFVAAHDRERFIIARATLRILLGKYLQIPSGTVRLEKGPLGKPCVAEGDLALDLRFNLSHSHGVAVFAFAAQKEVGVDVEKIREEFASREISRRYFSPEEIGKLDALEPQIYTQFFFQCWTRKEAYIKARGQGLQIPLDSFSVSLGSESPLELVAADSERWSMYSFEPFPEFASAVVAEKAAWTLSFFEGSEIL
jgi:4'-phosphopantetheinyl transferase